MFEKLLNSLFGKWYRPFIFIFLLNLFYLFIIILTFFRFIEIHDFRDISFLSIIILFIVLCIIHIYKSQKKAKQILFLIGSTIVLILSLSVLERYSYKVFYLVHKNYISDKFKNTCIQASNGLNLKNKMYKLTYETRDIPFHHDAIKIVSPTSKLLQKNNVPYLYLNVFYNKIPYACFWDKAENKPKYLISQSEKTFGSLNKQSYKPTIFDNEILLALKQEKSGSSKKETKKVVTNKPTKEDFIKGAKDSYKEFLRSYAPKNITDEQLEKNMEELQIDTCNISSILYDEELNIYKTKFTSCALKDYTYLTYKDNKWVRPDNDALYCLTTKEKNTLSAWKTYIEKFPNGKCKENAEKRINELNPLVFSIKTEKNIDSFKLTNNEKLIAVNHNKQIDIYNLEEKKAILTFKHNFYKPKLSFNKNDDILFVSADNKEGKLFSLSNGKEIQLKNKLPKKNGLIFEDTIVFHHLSPDRKKLHIEQYDINTGKKIREKSFYVKRDYDRIRKYKFSPNGRYLVIGLDEEKESIILWDNKSWKILWEKTIKTFNMNFDFTPDSKHLIYFKLGSNPKIYNLKTAKLIKTINQKQKSFAINNSLDKYVSDSIGISLYDVETNKRIQGFHSKQSKKSHFDKIDVSFKNTDDLIISKFDNRIDFWKEVAK